MATTTTIRGFRMDPDTGELRCKHRDLSVCDACFNSTPGLVNVYTCVYPWAPEQWTRQERTQIALGEMEQVTLSPGTIR